MQIKILEECEDCTPLKVELNLENDLEFSELLLRLCIDDETIEKWKNDNYIKKPLLDMFHPSYRADELKTLLQNKLFYSNS